MDPHVRHPDSPWPSNLQAQATLSRVCGDARVRLFSGRVDCPTRPTWHSKPSSCSSSSKVRPCGKRGEKMNRATFEQLVADALKGIPRRFLKALATSPMLW